MWKTLFVAAVTGIVLLSPGIAPGAEAREESHCVVDVIGERAGGELAVSEPRCYGTFAEAMRDASNGVLVLPRLASGSVMFGDSDVAAAASLFTIGIHFDGFNGAGSSMSVVGTSCSGGWLSLSRAWVNRISSTFNGCNQIRHYDTADRGGIFEDTFGAGTRDNLSRLNNRVGSISYH